MPDTVGTYCATNTPTEGLDTAGVDTTPFGSLSLKMTVLGFFGCCVCGSRNVVAKMIVELIG